MIDLDPSALATWGAFVSTSLAVIKLYETFWKDRVRLDTSCSLTGEIGGSHEITIANLSAIPVQVNSWTLAWEPKFFHPMTKKRDVTPEWFNISGFKIAGYSSHTMKFKDQDQFSWSFATTKNRNLCLRLSIFGSRKSKRLIVKR